MGKLWQELVETLRQRPLLWLPVLLADLLGYLVNLGRDGILRAVLLHQTAQQSVLGGEVVHGPMTASAVEHTTIIALLLTWCIYFLRIFFYSAALFAMAGLLAAYRERQDRPAAAMVPSIISNAGNALDLTLRALAIYALGALLSSWLTTALSHHGQNHLLNNPFFGFGLMLLVLLTLAILLPPVAVRLLAGTPPQAEARHQGRTLAIILVLITAFLSNIVGGSSRQLAQAPALARYPLEIIASLVVALPYVLLFAGLILLAQRVRRQAE